MKAKVIALERPEVNIEMEGGELWINGKLIKHKDPKKLTGDVRFNELNILKDLEVAFGPLKIIPVRPYNDKVSINRQKPAAQRAHGDCSTEQEQENDNRS